MTKRKLKSLLIQIKMKTKISEVDEFDLRDYAVEIAESSDSEIEKKLIAWYLSDAKILEEITDCLNEIWDLKQVVDFLRKFDPRLKKHENRKRN